MKIGKTIKIIRTFRGLKQKELARRMDVTPNYLSSVENEKREPSLTFLKNFADELDVPLSFLFVYSIDEDKLKSQNNEILEKFKNILLDFQELKHNDK